MFIKNFNSINQGKTIKVDDKTREYLIKNGFCELSHTQEKWIFIKSKELLNIINEYKNGGDDNDG